jgi:hypothetical protein
MTDRKRESEEPIARSLPQNGGVELTRGRLHATSGGATDPAEHGDMTKADDGPSTSGRRFMIGLLWFGSIATVAYWVIWFGVDRAWLATADTPSYYAFENAFPLSDAWVSVTGALAAVALTRRRPTALLWMLLAGSAIVFLGGMDVLFDLENGIYVHGDPGNVAVELLINVGCLAGGAAVMRFAWRHHRHLLGQG